MTSYESGVGSAGDHPERAEGCLVVSFLVLFVLNLVFVTRYMGPEGPRQRRAFLGIPISDPGSACAVIVGYPPLLPSPPEKK